MRIYMFCMLGIIILVSLFSIYVKRKKDKNEPIFKKSESENSDSTTVNVEKNSSKGKISLKDFIGIQKIEKGIFHKENNEYCIVLAASFVNFDLKSPVSQRAILLSYQALFRVIKFPLQIIGQSVSQDMRKEEARFEKNLEMMHPAVQKYNRTILRSIKNRSENEFRITKRLYYVISYAPVESRIGSLNKVQREKLIETNLKLRANTVEGMLRACEIQVDLMDSLSAMEVMKRYLNRDRMNSTPIEQVVLDEKLSTHVTWDITTVPGIEDLLNGVEEVAHVLKEYGYENESESKENE